MSIEISSTQAARNFGDCLARVKYRGDSFVITRNDEAIAELSAASGSRRGTWAELEKSLEELPHDSTFADGLEKVNAGPDDEAHFRRVQGLGVRLLGA